MNAATHRRIGWTDLPADVRSAVERIVGGVVVAAVSQPGGFSPGTADRVRTADGRRAFVKAVSAEQNDLSPRIHRQEARTASALPTHAPVPRLLGCHDDGDWVALVYADVEGRQPVTPWRVDELAAVLDTLAALAAGLTPAPTDHVPTAAERLGYNFAGWHRVAADPPEDLDRWVRRHLARLRDAADHGLTALVGDTLCHVDVRADNLLVDATGRVTVVDWPWACRGPAWLDSVILLINVALHGGPEPEALLRSRPLTAEVDPDTVTGILAGWAGFFLDAARRPAPPGMPTVRAFQRAQAEALLSWLAHRLRRPE